MKTVWWVALGGALGAVCRYGLSKGLEQWNPDPSFSVGVLMANLSGCFLMGFLVVALGNFEGGQREMATAFLLTGFLGSLTTFSSFILEFFRLAQQNGPKLLVSHSVAHLAVGLLGLFLGHAVAQRLWQS